MTSANFFLLANSERDSQNLMICAMEKTRESKRTRKSRDGRDVRRKRHHGAAADGRSRVHRETGQLHGAGVGPTKGLSEKSLNRSLSSIHILYNHTPRWGVGRAPGRRTPLLNSFHTEVEIPSTTSVQAKITNRVYCNVCNLRSATPTVP